MGTFYRIVLVASTKCDYKLEKLFRKLDVIYISKDLILIIKECFEC